MKFLKEKKVILCISVCVCLLASVVGLVGHSMANNSSHSVDDLPDVSWSAQEEYAYLEKLGELLELETAAPDAPKEIVEIKETMNYNANLSYIESAYIVYAFMYENYGEGFFHEHLITDDKELVQYFGYILDALEKGKEDASFIDGVMAERMLGYINPHIKLIEGTELYTRFNETFNYYYELYGQ